MYKDGDMYKIVQACNEKKIKGGFARVHDNCVQNKWVAIFIGAKCYARPKTKP